MALPLYLIKNMLAKNASICYNICMVKTVKVVKKPATKKAVKKVAKKTTSKKANKVIDYSRTEYMQNFLSSMMPEMIGQLANGVNHDRMVEIVSYNRGIINFSSGTAEFKFGGKNYSASKDESNYWKLV